MVADADLTLLDAGVDVIIKPPAEALAEMPDVVREMHTTSGLLAELPSGITLAEAQDIVLGYVRGHVPEAKKVPLCGNSIATDRWFIARDMPDLDAYLHYRMIDVSSIKELARRWYPRSDPPPPRPSAAGTGPWPTSGRACRNCATTARRYSFRSRARTPRPHERSPPGTPSPAGTAAATTHRTESAPDARAGPDRYTSSKAARCPPGQRAFCCRRSIRRRWWA